MSVEAVLILYLVLEVFEMYFQKGNSLKQILLYNSRFFVASPLMYASMHLSYFFLLFLYLHYDAPLLFLALVLKSIDIGYKLFLIGKINSEGEGYLDKMLEGKDIAINPLFKYISPVVYFLLVYSAIAT